MNMTILTRNICRLCSHLNQARMPIAAQAGQVRSTCCNKLRIDELYAPVILVQPSFCSEKHRS